MIAKAITTEKEAFVRYWGFESFEEVIQRTKLLFSNLPNLRN